MRPPTPSLFVFALLAFVHATPASAQWVTDVVDTLAGTAASERSTRFGVAVDANDAPHAIWSAGTRIYYSRKDAGSWIPPIELGGTDASYSLHVVAVVPGATKPCVLYSRRPFALPNGELLLAEWNGFGFDVHALTADSMANAGPAMALDASGAYHVVCVVQVNGEWRIRYLTNATGVPTDTVLALGPLGTFGSGATPSIAVEPNGVAHVVYRGVSGTYRTHHAQNSTPGSADWTWETLVTPNFEDLGSDIRIDRFGTVHVVNSGDECDICTRRAHVFQRPAGGNWSAPTPIVHANPLAGFSGASLAVDAGGRAHVALPEISGTFLTGKIYHASSRTNWAPTLAIGADHGTPSLAADSQGRLHMVCTTGPNTGVRNVLYLRSQASTTDVEGAPSAPAIGWRASPNPFRGSTALRLALAPDAGATARGPAHVIIFDIAGRAVRHLQATPVGGGFAECAWDGRSDEGRILPAGVYRVASATGRLANGTRAAMVVKLP